MVRSCGGIRSVFIVGIPSIKVLYATLFAESLRVARSEMGLQMLTFAWDASSFNRHGMQGQGDAVAEELEILSELLIEMGALSVVVRDLVCAA